MKSSDSSQVSDAWVDYGIVFSMVQKNDSYLKAKDMTRKYTKSNNKIKSF